MPKLNQRGVIAQVLILILLILGAIVGVYLVQNRTNLLPKAGGSAPIGPQTNFELVGINDCPLGLMCIELFRKRPKVGEEFEVKLYARSDLETANLFSAKLNFPNKSLEIVKIKTENSFVKNWVENDYSNEDGTVSLVGGVPNPGFQTQTGGESALMATIIFKGVKEGESTIVFTDSSAIYSNLNNINILTRKEPYTVSVRSGSADDEEGRGILSLDPKAGTYNLGCSFSVDVDVDTGGLDTDGTDVLINYDPTKLTVESIDFTNLYDKYPGNSNDPQKGRIVISGLSSVEQPVNGKGTLATINFTVKKDAKEGETSLIFDFDPKDKLKTTDSNIVQRGKVTDILDSVVNATFNTGTGPCTVVTPSPAAGRGDGNGDSKIDLSDLSVLLTYFNNMKGYKKEVDLNDDRKVNTIDFSMMRNLLIDKGVIKGDVKTKPAPVTGCPGGVNACGDSDYGLLGKCGGGGSRDGWVWFDGTTHPKNEENASDYWCRANAPDGKDFCYTCRK